MYAAVLSDHLRVIADYRDPAPEAQECLVRVVSAGICNTDLELVKGYMGFQGVPGHEFVGIVEQGPAHLVGRRVVGEINVACGQCDMCHTGAPSQCRNRTTVGIDRHDGAFAERLALQTDCLHVVPDSVSDDEAVFVEPLAAALEIPQMEPILPTDDVVLIGAGKLGLLCAQVIKLTGARLRAVVRRERQIDLLRRWGIEPVGIDDIAPSSVDVVVDCTGTSEGFAAALSIVRPRGVIHLKSTYVGLPHADLTKIVVDEVRVIGSRCGPFPAALRLLEAKAVDVLSLIDARYPLQDALIAFEHAARPGALKILLDVTPREP